MNIELENTIERLEEEVNKQAKIIQWYEKENKILRKNAENNDKVVDKLNDLLSDEFLEVIDRDTLLDILNEVTNNE